MASGLGAATAAALVEGGATVYGLDHEQARRRDQSPPTRRRSARSPTPRPYARLVAVIVADDYLNGDVIRMDGALRTGPR